MAWMLLQVLYVTLGLVMNLMSLRHHKKTGQLHTPTSPAVGIGMMLLYALCLPLAFLQWRLPFQIAMVLFALLIGAGGVLRHLISTGSERYSSDEARWAAIGINSFGVTMSVYAI